MSWRPFKEFVKYESSAGIVLFFAAMMALLVSNTPMHIWYEHFLEMPVAVHFGMFYVSKSLHHWINDGLMAVFFLLVGLEVKREMLQGELNSLQKAILPAVAAIGGMVVPAGIFMLFNHQYPYLYPGWAIPTATDIAFSLGILVLFGKRLPISLRVFLTALAIFDDIGAIIIIALFYTQDLSMAMMVYASVCMALLLLLNRLRVSATAPYVIVGIALWLCVLKSGVHATMAGIILAWAIPIQPENGKKVAPLIRWEHGLHPWVAYFIIPVFAFANAGVHFASLSLNDIQDSLTLGCFFGLFIGKQIGVWGASILAVQFKLAQLPRGLSSMSIYGLSLLAGIGFTMSLFIGSLAYDHLGPLYFTRVQVGVLLASLLSGVGGYLVLRTQAKSK